MTSDLSGTPEAAASPAKPPRRRATRSAAAPTPVDTTAAPPADTAPVDPVPAGIAPVDTPVDQPPVDIPVDLPLADGAAVDAPPADPLSADLPPADPTGEPSGDDAPADTASDEPSAADGPTTEAAPDTTEVAPEAADVAPEATDVAPPAAEEPAPAKRTRRATSTGTTPKRATRGRAAKSTDAGEPPALDVLAELGRRPQAEPAADDAPAGEADDAVAVDAVAPGGDDAAAPATGDATAPAGRADAPEPEAAGGPRLATTALLFQPPEPTAARPRRRRVIAPAGPPQFVVPEVVSPEPAAAAAPVEDRPTADEPAEPGRRRRRATRTTAAPEPVADVDTAPEGEGADAATDAPTARRASRRRARAERGDETDALDVPEEDLGTPDADAAQPVLDDAAVVEPVEDDEDDADEDEGTEEDAAGGAPRRRRRRGGRGRRSRSGGDAEPPRPSVDGADDTAGDEGDEDEDEDAPGADADADDTAGEGEGEESLGSSRRRRRRRRSGRGADVAEAETDAGPARVRTPRAPSDEVTALRGSTRLEAKRQRRREGRDAGRRRQIITEAEFLARREAVDRTMVVRERDGRTQIAVLEDGVLVEHYVSRQAQVSMAGNVYLGRVQNVLPSMEAAFVDVGKGRNAVLYAGEVNWDAAGLEGQPRRIEQALKSGDSVLVQVTKDPIGHKGARLTSQITLAGRYLVYVPGGGMTGISRKLPDNERSRLKKLLREIVPDTAGVIVRTAAEGASEEELRADITRLQEQWAAIEKKAKTASAPALLQGEPDLAIRVVRDIFNDDFASLVVQGDEAWATISGYIGALAPDLADKVTRWTAEGDVFAAHRIDEQLAKGMDRKVWLPSGGSLVIDRTEAMTVVDVNTGKFTGSGGTLEETVTRNNLEAAEEIVRQLRLRDIGGIIVIDFIDMVLELNRDLVLRRLVECLGRDRTKHQVAEVTSLGLVQMTRKRVGQGLVEAFSETCEHCNGRGFIVHSDPIDRGAGAPPAPPATTGHQPPAGGDAGRGGRRRRGGAKEPGAAVPSGLPMVPVLPEAREAVKATLATIAAAAAHAHEHDHDGHGTHAAPVVASAAGAPPASAPAAEAPAAAGDGEHPAPASAGSAHPDAVAAVSEALAALRLPTPSADGEATSSADEAATAPAPDGLAGEDDALALVPVGPEVFDLDDAAPDDAVAGVEPPAADDVATEPTTDSATEPEAADDAEAVAGTWPAPDEGPVGDPQ